MKKTIKSDVDTPQKLGILGNSVTDGQTVQKQQVMETNSVLVTEWNFNRMSKRYKEPCSRCGEGFQIGDVLVIRGSSKDTRKAYHSDCFEKMRV